MCINDIINTVLITLNNSNLGNSKYLRQSTYTKQYLSIYPMMGIRNKILSDKSPEYVQTQTLNAKTDITSGNKTWSSYLLSSWYTFEGHLTNKQIWRSQNDVFDFTGNAVNAIYTDLNLPYFLCYLTFCQCYILLF